MLDHSVATVFVGEGKDESLFVVHKDLLMLHSVYFTNLLTDIHDDQKIGLSFPEGPFKTPSPPQFAYFISWLYTGAHITFIVDCGGMGDH
jgi:hypothetical protein